MEHLPLDDLEYIIDSSDPDAVVAFCTTTSTTLRDNCEIILKNKLRGVNLSFLPYRPNNTLELYTVYKAITSSSKIGNKLVNPFYGALMAIKLDNKENFKETINQLIAINSEPSLYSITIDNDITMIYRYIAQYERYDFLNLFKYSKEEFFGALLNVKDANVEILEEHLGDRKEYYETPTGKENMERMGLSKVAGKIRKDSSEMFYYYYSVNDRKSIEKYNSRHFAPMLATSEDFISYIDINKLSFKLLLELWTYNRWDLWNILLDRYDGQIPAPKQKNKANTYWMSSFSLPRALNMYPYLVKRDEPTRNRREGTWNDSKPKPTFIKKVQLQEDSSGDGGGMDYEPRDAIEPTTQMREYYRFCYQHQIRPYIYDKVLKYNIDYLLRNRQYIGRASTKKSLNSNVDLDDILTSKVPDDYYISTNTIGEIMQALGKVELKYREIYYGINPMDDETLASLLFRRGEKISKASYQKYYEMSKRQNDFRPLIFWLEHAVKIEGSVNKNVAEYYLTRGRGNTPAGASDFNSYVSSSLNKKRSTDPDIRALARGKLTEGLIKKYPNLAVKFFTVYGRSADKAKRIIPNKISDDLFDYFALDLASNLTYYSDPYILDRISKKALAQFLPMVLTFNFNEDKPNQNNPTLEYAGNADLKWYYEYFSKNKSRLTLDKNAFVTYYPAICLVGVHMLLDLFPAAEVLNLLKFVRSSKLVPSHIKEFIDQYL